MPPDSESRYVRLQQRTYEVIEKAACLSSELEVHW